MDDRRRDLLFASAPSVPYYVDATSSSTGRHIKPTKRRISFKFGFASFPHLALGCQGPACRGAEHEVIFLWSLASGKRRVILDGRDVYFSQHNKSMTGKFVHSFVLPGDVKHHSFQLVADGYYNGHFDLLIDGQSVFQMLKIYQLGGFECRERYYHVFEYAKRVPRRELEQRAAATLAQRNQSFTTRRLEQSLEYSNHAARLQLDGEVDSLSEEGEWENFTHLDPRNNVEEKQMLEAARRRSLLQSASRPPPAIIRLGKIDETQEVDLIDLRDPPLAAAAAASSEGVVVTPDDTVSALGDDASSVGGWGSNIPFSSAAPPPPTWEQTQEAFGRTSDASRASVTAQTTQGTFSSVSGWGTAPTIPSAYVNHTPAPPTWEQIQAAFRSDASHSSSSHFQPPRRPLESGATAFSHHHGSQHVPLTSIRSPPPPTWEQTQAAFGSQQSPPTRVPPSYF